MIQETTRSTVLDDEIALLVDGELGEERRSQVLRSLDTESDGWKRCAVAFLEAQLWREALALGSPQPEAVMRRRRWASPLAAVAAAVMGFVVALVVAKPVPAEAIAAEPPVEPAPLVRLVPFPVIEERGFVQASDASGKTYYQAKGDVPRAVLSALVQAGHEVKRVERTIDVPREGGDPFQLPITETQVFLNYEL